MASLDLQRAYHLRFQGEEQKRKQVWEVLTEDFFSHWIQQSDTVLDLGAGYCEFINSIKAARRYALDLNPATAGFAADGVNVLAQDASNAWRLDPGSVDVIFTSNFLEHLPSKGFVLQTLEEAYRALRVGGRFFALGPNARFCYDVYWDYFDHHIPLTERSLGEAFKLAGFDLELVIPRFLPYTMKGRLASTRLPFRLYLLLFKMYLRCPAVWALAGKQFLILARKPDGQPA